MFQVALSESGNGLDACKNCELLPTKPGNQSTEESDDALSLLYQTGQIIDEEDAGFATNWNEFEPELSLLVIEWRRAEKELRLLFELRNQAFIKSHYEK